MNIKGDEFVRLQSEDYMFDDYRIGKQFERKRFFFVRYLSA